MFKLIVLLLGVVSAFAEPTVYFKDDFSDGEFVLFSF